MNTTENSKQEQSKNTRIPRWMAIIVALAFWIIGIPLFYGVGPWALSLLTLRHGWVADRPGFWNLFGLIPILIATACLIWVMVLHFAQTPKVPEIVELERTPKYLLLAGPYEFTRNPMYLAELALRIVFYGSAAIFIAFLVAGTMFNIVIVPRKLFGNAENQELVDALTDLYAEAYGVEPARVTEATRLRAMGMLYSDLWVNEGKQADSPLLAQEEEALYQSYKALKEAIA